MTIKNFEREKEILSETFFPMFLSRFRTGIFNSEVVTGDSNYLICTMDYDDIKIIIECSQHFWKFGINSKHRLLVNFKGAFDHRIVAFFYDEEANNTDYMPFKYSDTKFSGKCVDEFRAFKVLDIIAQYLLEIDYERAYQERIDKEIEQVSIL